MALSEAQLAKCVDWCKSRKWQTLNRGKWKYIFHEKTLVRYVEEAKMDEEMVTCLLEYLTSADCMETLRLYGQDVSPEWTPTRAWHEVSNKSVGNVRAVRLYHALATVPDAIDDGPYVVEDGCAYKVSLTYYWKRASVPDAPPSTSGVSYRVTSIQPDPDTGLFNYAIEKRERVQQDIPEYLMRTTLYEDQSEEVHLGVRGDLDAGGKQASVANGKTVTRKVTKNQDCTHDVHNTITQDKAVPESSVTVAVGVRGTSVTTENRNMPAPASTDGLGPGESVRNQKTDSKLWNQTIRRFLRESLTWLRESCRKTIFAHTHSETVNVKDKPSFDHVVEASNGHIVEKSVHKTEEGFDVTEQTTDELPVSNASESIHVGLEGTTISTTHRNQPSKAPDPTDIGESVENTKTPGGLWNHTIRKRVLKSLVKLGENCRKTFFSHSHSKSIVQGSDPGFDHVAEAANGTIRDKRVSRTSTGAYRVDESETTEKPVSKSNERIEKTLDGTVRTVTNRNQSSPAPEPTDIGESVENSRTEGGLWNQVIRKLIPNSMLKIAESCSKTLYAHRHSKSTVQSNDPGFSHVEEAGGGRIASKNVSRTHNGSYRIEEGETVEKPVPKAERTARMTLNGLTVRVVNRNQSAPLPDPTEVGKSVSNRRTDGGLYDTVETTEGEKPAGKTGESCSRDKFTHRHSVTKNEKELQNPETVFTTGQIVHKSGHLTGNGTANNTTETTTAVPQIQRYHWEDERGKHYVVKYRNQQSEINEAPSDADSVSLNDSVNAFGLHDGLCTYSFLAGRWKFSAKDYKFIKHGARQEYYDVKRRRRTRIWSHRKWIIEPRRIRGDAFWDYLNELARANPERTTPGTLGVKLIERYSDSDGNLLAEWVQVDLVQAEAWQVCDNDCKHAFVAQQMSNDHRFIINSLLASLS